MARTNFTPINKALESLITAIAELRSDLLAQANSERREALELHRRMQETQQEIAQLGLVAGGAVDALEDTCGFAHDVSDMICNILEDGFGMIPTCNYEDFVGFCAGCGEAISKDDERELVDGELWHKNCIADDAE